MHVHCYEVSMQNGNRNKTSCKYQQQILLQRKQKFTLFVRQFTSIYPGRVGEKKEKLSLLTVYVNKLSV